MDRERLETGTAATDGGTVLSASITAGGHYDGMRRRVAGAAATTGACFSGSGISSDAAAGWTVPEDVKHVFGQAVRPILWRAGFLCKYAHLSISFTHSGKK